MHQLMLLEAAQEGLLRGDLDEKPAAIRMRIRRRGVGMIAGARLSRKHEPRAG